jgi:hypothetical protein
MVTIADLRARNTLPTWQEAVAVVQELAHATSSGRGSAARLPEIEHISLNVDGTIALLPGSVVPGHPVRHLAYVLLLLLDGVPAPDELIELAQRNRAEAPPCTTLDEFSSALKFFERPGRTDDIAKLVARAAVAEEQSRADEELKLLKARALVTEKTKKKEEPAETVSRRPVPRWAFVVLGVACLVAVLGAVAWRSALTRLQAGVQPPEVSHPAAEPAGPPAAQPPAAAGQPAPAAAEAAPTLEPSFVARVAHAMRSAVASLTGSKASDDVRPAVVSEPVKERPRPSKRRSSPMATNKPSAVSDIAVTIRVTELGGYPLLSSPALPVATTAISAPDNSRTYSAQDDDVLPPVMTRPVIPGPPAPDAPTDTYAVFDLVVDRQGNVEQVKTVSVPSRYRDKMIVAHLKAWGFKPATKEGQPVRYRIRIRLIV